MNLIQHCGLTYELNNSDFTASICSSKYSSGDIIIPRSINYQSHNYLITCIKKESFKGNDIIKSISFPEDSALLSIEENAFENSSIESLSIPSSLIELKEGWCNDTANLIRISLSKENKHYKYLQDTNEKIIIGKINNNNNNNNEEFETIVFACRNINFINIPTFIKKIESYSFSKCNKIEGIEIEEQSQLSQISKGSFSYSSINTIFIPQNVKTIETNTFSWCSNLKTVIFSEHSELKTIEEKAFFDSTIESIIIHSNAVDFNEGWCGNTMSLIHVSIPPENKNIKYLDSEHKIIVGKTDKNSDQFDVILFASRDINQAIIPSSIKRIGSFAFSWCKDLQNIEFKDDSQLISIGESAFSDSSIKNLTIPKGVTHIKSSTFWWCRNLNFIDFQENSELISIEKNAFNFSTIKSLSIPSKVKDLHDGWCINTKDLIQISLSKENKYFKYLDESNEKIIVGKSSDNDSFDSIVFVCKNIESAIIPSFIKYINSHSFAYCSKLKEIYFTENSQLLSIGEFAFAYSTIEKIKIPKNVKKIQLKTFYKCTEIKEVDFYDNSELNTIEEDAFSGSSIESLSIPSSLIELKEGWCNDTANLIRISLSKENKHYKYLQDTNEKIIIGKINNINNDNDNEEEFETIVFACRNINFINIPTFIKKLESYSFSKCNKIEGIEIEEQSQLSQISKGSFSYSSINTIFIPQNVKTIETNTFTRCKKLKQIEFSENSKLQKIEEYSFSVSTIERIIIPKFIGGISRGSFSCCSQLKFVEFLGEELFIGHFCFNFCENLTLVSFPNAKKVSFSNDALNSASLDLIIFISHDSKLILL